MVLADVFFSEMLRTHGGSTLETPTLAFDFLFARFVYVPYSSEGAREVGSLLTALETAHMIGKSIPFAVSK